MSNARPIKVIFVCLGNICRSPTADGVMRRGIENHGLQSRIQVDSAGIGDWYIGKPPDSRAQQAALQRGFDISDVRARQVQVIDLVDHDWIIAMDEHNLADLNILAERAGPHDQLGRIVLFSTFCAAGGPASVPDPYMGASQGFETVLDMVEDGIDGLIKRLTATT